MDPVARIRQFDRDHAMLRGFTDSTGVEWRVWEVYPTREVAPTSAEALAQSRLKETAFENGWLCFESQIEKRRLAPIPSGWEFREVTTLEELCHQATPVPQRKRWSPGVA
jgi:hypothetical protein